LIVCDIMMPELDGYGVLDELRKDHQTASIPFIFLTAKTDKSDIRLGMGLGADDYLTKPFMTADLLNTIRARLERRDQLEAQAEKRMRELRESILTALPHELRTPLNSVIGFSEMLIAEAPRLKADQIVEWSQHINTAALRLYRLIENYLMFVRVETLARNPEKRAALKSLVTPRPKAIIEVQALQKAQQVKRENDLKLNLDDVDGVHIAQQDLTRVADELVDNAFKFSDPNTPVELSSTIAEGKYTLNITDHGRGMRPQQIESVGMYMQFDRWLYEQQGMGLGLMIARRLTEVYGGSLTLESIPDQYLTARASFLTATAVEMD
jgi:signal transduction histidine kinase